MGNKVLEVRDLSAAYGRVREQFVAQVRPLVAAGASVAGFDLSGGMVAQARQRYPALPFCQADLRSLPAGTGLAFAVTVPTFGASGSDSRSRVSKGASPSLESGSSVAEKDSDSDFTFTC